MPVLVTADVLGQTAQGYDGMLNHLSAALNRAPGFVLHTVSSDRGGWRVLEIWESKTTPTSSSRNTRICRRNRPGAHFRSRSLVGLIAWLAAAGPY
jgi:hypothetical protein